MSKDIYNVKLIELLPPNLKDDPDIIAASKAIDKSHKELVDDIKNCFTIAGIDNAREEVVDHLAVEMNSDFYEQDLPLEDKRELAKNAYVYHFTKGTPFAVEQLLSDAFSETTLHEWFEYNGEPYTFKVVSAWVSSDKAGKILKAVNSVKNKRSWLKKIESQNINLYVVYFDEYRTMSLQLETGAGHTGQWPAQSEGNINERIIQINTEYASKKQDLPFLAGFYSGSEVIKYPVANIKEINVNINKVYGRKEQLLPFAGYLYSGNQEEFFNNGKVYAADISMTKSQSISSKVYNYCNTFDCGEVAV